MTEPTRSSDLAGVIALLALALPLPVGVRDRGTPLTLLKCVPDAGFFAEESQALRTNRAS